MGGNSRAINRDNGEVLAFAEKINVSEIGRQVLASDTLELLSKINKLFFAKHQKVLWRGTPTFSGSTKHLFDVSISDEEFIAVKPIIGDVDVMISEENLQKLFDFLASIEGLEILPNVFYLGQNNHTLRGQQINSVFKYKNKNLQIDFEGVKFENGMPTCFAKFAHSSDWNDVKLGIKGLAHKYLLMTLAWSVIPSSDIVVLTDKSPLYPQNKVKLKALKSPPRMLSFSVDSGLRVRLQKQTDVNGNTITINSKTAYKEIPIEKSVYLTDLQQIFELYFKVRPSLDEMKLFWSFSGLLELCSTYLTETVIRELFDQLVRYKLFGQGQKLDRDSSATDKSVKTRIIAELINRFPYLKESSLDINSIMFEYYENYSVKND